MILSVDIHEKSFGFQQLFDDLKFTIQPKEKVGLIGRNGSGKTTLFSILIGSDKDYDGEIIIRKGTVVAFSRQEHESHNTTPVIEYILSDLPQYSHLKHILDTYPETMMQSAHKQAQYADAVEHFSSLGYFEIEDRIVENLRAYQIDSDMSARPLGKLSGGQKRLAELVKIQASKADIVLVDEPTNHMDYAAKDNFIKWLQMTPEAAVVITHDRDVLKAVDRIIELRDGMAFSYKGNYDDYLRVNTIKIVSELNEFSIVERRMLNLKEDVIRFKRLKERSRDPGTISRFKSLQLRAEAELNELSTREKPSFWIDRDSSEQLNDKISKNYEKHKTKNIRIGTKEQEEDQNERRLIDVHDLSLGYDSPLFEGVSFRVSEGSRVRIHGRNGAGKSTLASAIIKTVEHDKLNSSIFKGYIDSEPALKIGVYRQEVEHLAGATVYGTIEASLRKAGQPLSDQKIRSLMGDYLFDPVGDIDKPVALLSGGQKARLQLIDMLAGDPQILILDEPTNHLDLPSIEELEDALTKFKGAVLYISHDSYFADKLGGVQVNIDKIA